MGSGDAGKDHARGAGGAHGQPHVRARVVGTAQGECAAQPCIKVFVAKKTPELLREIPSTIDGYLVDVQETGDIRALEG